MMLLKVQDLGFAYGEHRVVERWSQDFAPGLCWLRGEHGSGKSTCLKLLAGMLKPQRGTALLKGIDLARKPKDYRREAAWMGTDAPAFEQLSPVELYRFFSGLHPRADERQWAGHVEGFRLGAFLDRPLYQLSTGTRHKALMAAAMAMQTTLLLLDEPLGALDEKSRAYWRQCMSEAAQSQERLVLVASHEELGVANAMELLLAA